MVYTMAVTMRCTGMSAAESAFVIGYVQAAATAADLTPWFLALPILMYHHPTHAFCMVVATVGLVEAYGELPVEVRASAKFALASAAVGTVATLQQSASVVAADIATAG